VVKTYLRKECLPEVLQLPAGKYLLSAVKRSTNIHRMISVMSMPYNKKIQWKLKEMGGV
jgi:hypothetical protein